MVKKRLLSSILALIMLIIFLVTSSLAQASNDGVIAFVARLYRLTLDREADVEGLDYWINQLVSANKTGAEVAENFIFSKEFIEKNISPSNFLDIMYRAFFDREPDEEGKAYWLGKIEEGYNRRYIFANFVNSKEFTEICNVFGIVRGTIELNEENKKPQPAGAEMKVHFINVDQGDSILVQSPNGQNMLIDAGNDDKGDIVKEYLEEQGVKRIDVLVGTHPHDDHIGGLDLIIDNFDIGSIYMPKVDYSSSAYEDVLQAIQRKGLQIKTAKAGVTLPMEGVDAQILAPEEGLQSDNLHDYSAVIYLTYNNISMLFQGDAEAATEKFILDSGVNIDAILLKVGNHGSDSSTTQEYINAVNPAMAVVMAGENNEFGYPSNDVVKRLLDVGAGCFRTGTGEHVVFTTDGIRSVIIGRTCEINDEDSNEQSNNRNQDNRVYPENVSPHIKIIDFNPVDDTVTVYNSGDKDVRMAGWTLVSESREHIFYFPGDFILKAKTKVTISSGKDGTGDGVNTLFWKRVDVWNNDGDTVILYDVMGDEASRMSR